MQNLRSKATRYIMVHLRMPNKQIKLDLDQESKKYIRANRVKDRRLTISCLFLFSFDFLLTFFFRSKQFTSLKNTSYAFYFFWPPSTMIDQRQLFCYKRIFSFSKGLSWLTQSPNVSLYKDVPSVLLNRMLLTQERIQKQERKKRILKALTLLHLLCQRHGIW